MKKNILTLAFLVLGTGSILAADLKNSTTVIIQQTTKTSTFGVRGNCGMCEKTIEAAALKVKGVKKASWDKEKKQITVVYASETSIMDIHKAIASVGYDTEKIKADKSAYNSLPGCCQYDRNQEMRQEGNEEHNHSHEGHHH